MPEQRFKPLSIDEMTPDQRRIAERIASGPRGGLQGPFHPMLRSPGLADVWEPVGAYVRFRSVLPEPLKELAILVTARHWTSQFEWWAHRRLALAAGLGEAVCDAIAAGRRPAAMSADETAIYEFATAVLEQHEVSDPVFAAVKGRFGERGVVELIATVGHYCLVSMILNVDRHPIPEGAVPLRPLERGAPGRLSGEDQ
jgi:4-carboxymuconolactone decarboxylase